MRKRKTARRKKRTATEQKRTQERADMHALGKKKLEENKNMA